MHTLFLSIGHSQAFEYLKFLVTFVDNFWNSRNHFALHFGKITTWAADRLQVEVKKL